MFKFLKDKIKSAVSKISEKIEEEGKKEEIEVAKESPQAEQPAIKQQKPVQTPAQLPTTQTPTEKKQEPEPPKEEKKGFFSSIKSIFTKKEEEAPKEEPEKKTEEISEPEPQVEKLPEEKKSPVEIFAPQIVEEVKKEFEAPKEDIKPIIVESRAQKEIPTHQDSTPIAPKSIPSPKETVHPTPKVHAPTPSHTPKAAKTEQKKEHIPTQHKKEVPKAEHKKEQPAPKVEAIKIGPKVQPRAETTSAELKREQSTIEQKKDGIQAESKEAPIEEKKGFFSQLKEKILTTTINTQQFEDMFFDMELALLENNVAVEVIDKIKYDLKTSLVDHPIKRNKVEETVIISLKDSIKGLFEAPFDIIEKIKEKEKKPYIIALVGINGSGKTTSIAKLAFMLKGKGLSVVLAAGDTFRAASIEQLALHGEKLGIKVIKHDYGADPAAVAFDAIKHAEAKNVDVVLIDTAGRMHSNDNLIQEMQKIMRVAKPDVKIFVGESITGNDCVDQAKSFNEAIGLDGIILSKADIDEKGGAAVSISYVTKKPILYIGTGQEYNDIKPFDSNDVMQNLGLEE